MEFSPCPKCGAEYPTYYSPAGQLGTLCDNCGYASPDYQPPGER